MKLKQFRVRAFRCIHDTKIVAVSDTAALIGKNESGKTAILEALAHLNKDKPIDVRDICDDLVDDLKPTDRIVEGLFELTPSERDLVAKELPEISGLTEVRIFRTKGSNMPDYEFPTAQFPKKFSPNPQGQPTFIKAVEAFASKLPNAVDQAFQTEPAEKRDTAINALRTKFDAILESLPTADLFEYRKIDGLLKKLTALTNERLKGDKSVMISLGLLRRAFQGAFFLTEREPKAKAFFRDKLHPRLIYFPEYKVIDGIIDIKQYLQAPETPSKRSDIGYQFQRTETIRNLFHLAELNPAQLETMAANQPRLNSELVRSSQRLTKMLALTWRTKKIGVRVNYSGGTVTVEVTDIFPDGTTANQGLLDRRSAGFKWHFSFFVNFRAGIQQSAFRDAVLLLDEPGLNLHPEQQGGLVDVIRDLSQTNQVLYTTHSPFMIYNFDKGSLLIVEFDPATKASRIQQNFWDGDWQTIRPVLHAIGDSMLLKVFKGADVLTAILAVEGITDQRYLVTIAELDLSENDDSRLAGAEPMPSGGHGLVRERALHYRKRKKKVAALFDNEPEALAQAAELERHHFPKEAIVRIDVGKDEADIEDVFTEDDFLKVVNGFYSTKLRDAKNFANITKRDLEKAKVATGSPRIVKALETIFLSHSEDGWGGFDKVAVCSCFCDGLTSGTLKLSVKSKERFDKLFSQISTALEQSKAASTKERR